ncbi:MAG: MFS transporter [Bacteroidota bacterium]
MEKDKSLVEEKISIKEKIGFSLGDTASNLFFQTFIIFILYFYTDVFGISAAAAGTMFLVTRIWDSINDPIMGIISDRTNTKWGKFRPYLMWLAIPFGIVGVLTFTTPQLSMEGKIIYAYITYSLMMMVYTAINIPYSALMGVVSADPLQRTSFAQYRFIFAFAGLFLVQGLTLPLVNTIGGGNTEIISASVVGQRVVISEEGIGAAKLVMDANEVEEAELSHSLTVNVYKSELANEIDTSTSILYLEEGFERDTLNLADFFKEDISTIPFEVNVVNEASGFQGTMMIYAVAAILLFFIAFYTTKERVSPPKAQKTNLKNDVKDLLSNVPWLLLFVVGVVSLSYVSIRNGVIIYYFKYYVQDEIIVTSFFLAGTIVSIVAIAMTEWLSKMFGKKRVFIFAQIFSTLFMAGFFFLDSTDIVMMFVLQILFSFTAGPPAPIIFSMYTDCASYSEWKNGRRATGLVMSASTMAQKFGWTIGGALAGWILAMYGFKANIIQSTETIQGIILMMSLIPASGSFLAAILMYFYNLDTDTMNNIESELLKRRGKSVEEL